MSTKDKKDKGSGNLLDKLTTPVSMLSILGVLLVFGILFTVTDLSSGATTKEDEIQKQLSQKDEILEAYRLRSEEHTSELQSRGHLVCRLLLEKKKRTYCMSVTTAC